MTCSRCSASPTPSSCSPPSTRSSPATPRAALRAAAALASSGRDPGQVLRDLEVHARELLTVQVLGEVPAELRVTAERDQRLAQQAATLAETDAVRLLELVSAALEATANGAQARIQLELVLIKAAAPEMDPSMCALLARIERLERGGPRLQPFRRRPCAAPTPLGAAPAAAAAPAALQPRCGCGPDSASAASKAAPSQPGNQSPSASSSRWRVSPLPRRPRRPLSEVPSSPSAADPFDSPVPIFFRQHRRRTTTDATATSDRSGGHEPHVAGRGRAGAGR